MSAATEWFEKCLARDKEIARLKAERDAQRAQVGALEAEVHELRRVMAAGLAALDRWQATGKPDYTQWLTIDIEARNLVEGL